MENEVALMKNDVLWILNKKMLNKKTERKRLDGKKPNEPYFVRTKKAFLNDVFHNNEGKLHHENRRMRFIIRSEE